MRMKQCRRWSGQTRKTHKATTADVKVPCRSLWSAFWRKCRNQSSRSICMDTRALQNCSSIWSRCKSQMCLRAEKLSNKRKDKKYSNRSRRDFSTSCKNWARLRSWSRSLSARSTISSKMPSRNRNLNLAHMTVLLKTWRVWWIASFQRILSKFRRRIRASLTNWRLKINSSKVSCNKLGDVSLKSWRARTRHFTKSLWNGMTPNSKRLRIW